MDLAKSVLLKFYRSLIGNEPASDIPKFANIPSIIFNIIYIYIFCLLLINIIH